MSLSDDERDRLQEIETLTATEDPRFVAQLDLDAVIRRRRQLRRVCWSLLALGAVLMISGAGAVRGLISIVTVIAGAGAALILWSALTVRSPPAPRN